MITIKAAINKLNAKYLDFLTLLILTAPLSSHLSVKNNCINT